MKGTIYKALISVCILGLSTASLAKDNDTMQNNMQKNQWVCETNASSSSNPNDQNADKMMKMTKSGKSAFDFALDHCRDCNKITCTMQTSNNNTNQSNM